MGHCAPISTHYDNLQEVYSTAVLSLSNHIFHLIRSAGRSSLSFSDSPVIDFQAGVLDETFQISNECIGALEVPLSSKDA